MRPLVQARCSVGNLTTWLTAVSVWDAMGAGFKVTLRRTHYLLQPVLSAVECSQP